MKTSQIFDQNIDNIKRKVEDGKTLTALEVNLLKEVQEKQAQFDNDLTATKLSDVLGFNRETVRKRLAILGKTEYAATYTWREVVDAFVEFEKRKSSGIVDGKNYNSEHEKARKDAAIADRYELDLSVRKGELVEAKDVEETWKDHILRCRARLLGMSSKLAPLVLAEDNPKAVKTLIDQEINDALGELSNDDARDTD